MYACHCSVIDQVLYRSRSVMAGDDVLLQCELSSNLATPEWKLNGKELQGYGLNSGYRVGTDGLLVIEARPYQSGDYCCFALENGVHVPVVNYSLTVRQELPPLPPVQPTRPHLTTAIYWNVQTSPNDSPEDFHPSPMSPHFEFLSVRNMEAMYLSLITILGGLCFVLTVILLYVGFCLQGRSGKYSLRAAARTKRKRGAHMELKTISSHCNGKTDCSRRPAADRPWRSNNITQQGASSRSTSPTTSRIRIRQWTLCHFTQHLTQDEWQQLCVAETDRWRHYVSALLLLHRGAQQDPGEEEAHAAVQ